jgi:hypothetical protein
MTNNRTLGAGGTVPRVGKIAQSEGPHLTPKIRKPQAARTRIKTFAAWCQTPAPHELGLDPDVVARLVRAMSRPEMHGISTLDGLINALKWLRTFYGDELAWQRFTLAARYMWLAYKGRA